MNGLCLKLIIMSMCLGSFGYASQGGINEKKQMNQASGQQMMVYYTSPGWVDPKNIPLFNYICNFFGPALANKRISGFKIAHSNTHFECQVEFELMPRDIPEERAKLQTKYAFYQFCSIITTIFEGFYENFVSPESVKLKKFKFACFGNGNENRFKVGIFLKRDNSITLCMRMKPVLPPPPTQTSLLSDEEFPATSYDKKFFAVLKKAFDKDDTSDGFQLNISVEKDDNGKMRILIRKLLSDFSYYAPLNNDLKEIALKYATGLLTTIRKNNSFDVINCKQIGNSPVTLQLIPVGKNSLKKDLIK